MQPNQLILHLVIEYLETPELLRVCLVASAFYFPAIRRLYRVVSIISDRDLDLEEDEEKEKEEEKTNTWPLTRATDMKESNIHKLVSAVKTNKMLVEVIQSIEIPRLAGDFWIRRLLKLIKPKSIICEEPMKIPVSTACSVRRAIINVFSCSEYFSVLYDLTIIYDGQMEYPVFFEFFALSLIKSKAYLNLKFLEFQFWPIRDHRPWAEEEEYEFCPEWSVFFETFTNKKLKLELEALKIEREAWEDVKKVANIIKSAINMSKLTTLSLEVTYFFFFDDSFHNKSPANIFIPFYEDLSSLQNLYINYTSFKELDVESMETELRNKLPNQETKLWVNCENSSDDFPFETLVRYEDYERYQVAINTE